MSANDNDNEDMARARHPVNVIFQLVRVVEALLGVVAVAKVFRFPNFWRQALRDARDGTRFLNAQSRLHNVAAGSVSEFRS